MKLLKNISEIDEKLYTKPRKVRAVLLDENDNMALMYLPKYKYNDSNDLYMIPGGGIEGNENIEKALEREMLEETGCYIDIIEELGYIECAEDEWAAITYYYLAKVKGEKGQLQLTEHETESKFKLQWHSLEKALDFIANQVVNDTAKYVKLRDKIVISEVIKRLSK
ncbi:MAG: NUDIX hydrolase [Oscillospiraceae bacterium]|nr:NUDIX hydrolase [Oscillospiraceae bacterium]